MLTKKNILFVFCLFLIQIVFSQTTEGTSTAPKKKKKKATTETTTTKKKKGKSYLNDGRDWRVVYVVQVMSSSDRILVYDNKAKLMAMYPSNRVYVKNELPFYRLRLGFFPTKEKAEKFRKEIGNKFGEPALVVKDKVVLNTIRIKKKRPSTNPDESTTPSTQPTTTKKKDATKKN